MSAFQERKTAGVTGGLLFRECSSGRLPRSAGDLGQSRGDGAKCGFGPGHLPELEDSCDGPVVMKLSSAEAPAAVVGSVRAISRAALSAASEAQSTSSSPTRPGIPHNSAVLLARKLSIPWACNDVGLLHIAGCECARVGTASPYGLDIAGPVEGPMPVPGPPPPPLAEGLCCSCRIKDS
jgi:hypothetical protein